ncbi:RNA polymerase sigma-70 factor, ECF subfamily [Streptomyces sp. cf386]|uniref:RNA polymerase subunit sigma n=1 Tax=Streptomyces sp. cf386 TaxID=1761904 RepID=UPI00088282E4|nr:RNA polymerase subunit sigma [Streptomyces sp. cf386]SDM31928.1 RNA polymerase sigma-70 factor, ECF subfamily [Streptomyces sp. cf386]
MAGTDDAVPIAELLDERRHLLDIAYWMLGSGREAEGVIDETYRRWFELPDPARARITAPRSWLSQVAGSICLSRLALPRRDRERAVGEAAGCAGAVAQGMLAEEISGVLLEALDSLSPAERAAFVLNDVFGMAPGAVADIVRQTEPECAELADRARRSLRVRRARPTSAREHDAVARAVREACVAEDETVLASLLAADAMAFFDGGGKVRALIKPVHGNTRVARSLLTLLARHPRTSVHTHPVNGRTGLVVRYGPQVAAVISLDIAGPYVVQVWVTLNPDKLRTWNRSR